MSEIYIVTWEGYKMFHIVGVYSSFEKIPNYILDGYPSREYNIYKSKLDSGKTFWYIQEDLWEEQD